MWDCPFTRAQETQHTQQAVLSESTRKFVADKEQTNLHIIY